MKCHYEVLDLNVNASDDDIRKSYRKLALKWHPDKNLTNPEEAKDQFQLIQQAYEVLSDPQERAWYDKHRDSILRGGLGNNYKDDSINVYEYFTTSCFKGFDDDPKGFYTVYGEVFKRIAAEEPEFENDLGSDFEIPDFGDSHSSYDTVVHIFYSYWQSYSTKKSFSWLDVYDTRQAPNRRILRLMEKENKKIRDKARKERNEEVRALVAFVRKRDKRVIEHVKVLNEKALEKEKKALEARRKQKVRHQAEVTSYVESEWSKFSNLENELKEIEKNLAEEFEDIDNEDSSSLEDTASDLYCVACNKLFKTDKAFSNHEKSKKHRENVDLIKIEMLSGEEKLNFYSDVAEVNTSENDFKNEKQNVSLQSFESNDSGNSGIDEDCILKNSKPTKKKKKHKKNYFNEEENMTHNSKKENSNCFQVNRDGTTLDNLTMFDDDDLSDTLYLQDVQGKRRNRKNTFGIRESKSKKKSKKRDLTTKENPTGVENDILNPVSKINEEVNPTKEFECESCKIQFNSKNKLFKHLRETGHAVPDAVDCINSGKKLKKLRKYTGSE